MSILKDLAEFISSVNSKEFSEDHRRNSSRHMLDTLGAMLAGNLTAEASLISHVMNASPNTAGGSTLDKIVHRCALTRLTETDDIDRESCTTPGSVIFPVALTLLGELESANSRADVLGAIDVGYEAIIRLSRAISGPKIVYRGMWPTYFCAAFGSTACASKLFGLSNAQTENALSYALAGSTPWMPANPNKFPSRWIMFGSAARNGCFAAYASKAGFTTRTDLIEEGFLSQIFSSEANPQLLIEKLNPRDLFSTTSLKPYCSAKQAVSAIEAFGRLLDKGLDPREIQSVSVAVPKSYSEMIARRLSRENRLSSITGVAAQIALRAFDRDLLYNVQRDQISYSEEMLQLVQKVKVVADDELELIYPQKWPARVQAFSSGKEFSESNLDARGDPELPLSDQEISEKLRKTARLPTESQKELEELCEKVSFDQKVFPKLSKFLERLLDREQA